MVKFSILLVFSVIAIPSIFTYAYDGDDTYVKIQEMINDLGAPPDRTRNNGRVQKCVDGGTKKITVRRTKEGTTYEGIYKNCREYGRFRDGHTIITVGN